MQNSAEAAAKVINASETHSVADIGWHNLQVSQKNDGYTAKLEMLADDSVYETGTRFAGKWASLEEFLAAPPREELATRPATAEEIAYINSQEGYKVGKIEGNTLTIILSEGTCEEYLSKVDFLSSGQIREDTPHDGITFWESLPEMFGHE